MDGGLRQGLACDSAEFDRQRLTAANGDRQLGAAISALVYAGGTLYYSSFIHQAVMAVPTDGSAPSVLAAILTWELWVEGDHLLFSRASQSNRIFGMPLTGGTPQLVLDGGAGRSSPGLAMVHVFTSTDFFWIEQAGVDGIASPSTVWQPGPLGRRARAARNDQLHRSRSRRVLLSWHGPGAGQYCRGGRVRLR